MTRPMTEYYKKQLESGLLYQDFIYEILHKNGISTVAYGSKVFQQRLGENKARIEIKFDDFLATTGNLWIEVAEKSHPDNPSYVESGIYRECVEYVIGDYNIVFRFATTWLRRIHQSERYPTRENRLKTSRGFLLPSTDAQRAATQVYRVDCHEQMQEILRQAETDKVAARSEMHALLQQMRCDPNQLDMFGPSA